MSDDGQNVEDGLEKSYDLVLLGTGLVQSILSCVASKHGKKVLHLDRNDFYGEVYASHNLSTHLAYYSSKHKKTGQTAGENIIEGQPDGAVKFQNDFDDIFVAYFTDNVTKHKADATPRRPNRPDLYHPSSFGYAMEHISDDLNKNEHDHPVFRNYVKNKDLTRGRVWGKDRDFNIDTTSKVLFGSSPMVELMIASGVGNYLEFKSFEGLYFMVGGGGGGQDQIWKVPCSRNDVFNTTMLGALEKRSLMKFHQFVADWGRVNCGTEINSLNENELAIGRSLYRPQNKQLLSSGYNVDAFIDRPFQEFLADCKLSPKLQGIIMYALCCHEAPMATAAAAGNAPRDAYLTHKALNDMFMHIDSIGRFGETAFLTPLYGASEVVQAFCRMSAVWGGTFILQRSLSTIAVASPAADHVIPKHAAIGCVSVCRSGNNETAAAADLSAPATESNTAPRGLTVTDMNANTIDCEAFVCSASYWPGVLTRDTLKVSCTSVWLGTVVPLPRSVIIIPPDAHSGAESHIGNSHAVHIIQTDSSTNSAPDGAVVLHMSTLLEFAGAGAGAGAPVHWRECAALHAERARDLMDRVIAKLVESFAESLASSSTEELSRVVTIQPVYDKLLGTSSAQGGPATPRLPDRVRLCTESSDASLSMQSAYDEAKEIFAHLYPDKDFSLGVVDEIPSDVQSFKTTDGDNDDEAAYLEFTLSLAQKQASTDSEERAVSPQG